MANLLNETIKYLEKHNKTFDDVIGVCGDDFQISIEDFKKLANKEYDNGCGGQEVASDLKIVGKDFCFSQSAHRSVGRVARIRDEHAITGVHES